jgi:hypothetical protein
MHCQSASSMGKAILIILLLSAGWSPSVAASGFRITSDVIAAAGGFTSGTGMALGLTVGQSVIGRSVGFATTEEAGFWRWMVSVSGVGDGPPQPGDIRRLQVTPAFPNPFARSTEIRYTIPTGKLPLQVRARVFDATGRLVRFIDLGMNAAGEHRLTWDGLGNDGSPTGAGIYFCVIEAGSFRGVQRLVLTR